MTNRSTSTRSKRRIGTLIKNFFTASSLRHRKQFQINPRLDFVESEAIGEINLFLVICGRCVLLLFVQFNIVRRSVWLCDVRTSIYASAVCVFNLAAIDKAFSGPSKYQENSQMLWTRGVNTLANLEVSIIQSKEAVDWLLVNFYFSWSQACYLEFMNGKPYLSI